MSPKLELYVSYIYDKIKLCNKAEAYNKIVITEFLQVEELIDMKEGIEKYELFVKSYNYEREHGGINGMTPSEKFMKSLKQPILIM